MWGVLRYVQERESEREAGAVPEAAQGPDGRAQGADLPGAYDV